MMEAKHLVDALSGSFFALLGIWAAVGQRHWFLRVVVVSTILLGSLLLPAYEVVFEFGLAMALIITGVGVARRLEGKQLRFSMQTIMLVMVVAAVVCAVFASAPKFTPWKWVWVIGVGFFVASMALISLWFVYRKDLSWRFRVPVGLLGFVTVLSSAYALRGISRGLLRSDLRGAIAQYCTWEYFQQWLESTLFSTSLGFLIIITVLFLARGSGWFDAKSGETQVPSGRWTIVCRAGLVALMLAISTPLCYIGYRLMTPAAFPEFVMPEPNGYDDLLAAGEMLSDDIWPIAQRARTVTSVTKRTRTMTTEQLRDELIKLEPARARIREAFDKEVQVPKHSNSAADDRSRVVATRSGAVLEMEAQYAASRGDIDQFIEISLQKLRFRIAIEDGFGYDNRSAIFSFPAFATSHLGLLNAEQCKEYAQQMWDLSQDRMPVEKRVLIENYLRENRGWSSHMRRLNRQWSGRDPNRIFRQTISYHKARSQLSIVQLAIHAFELEYNSLPNSLDDLVPDYLLTDFQDPFGKEPYQYQLEGTDYLLFSVGPDEKVGQHQMTDQKLKAPNVEAGDDLVVYGPAK